MNLYQMQSRIQSQIINAGLHVNAISIVIGPQVAIWKLAILRDHSSAIKKLHGLSNAIAHVLGVEGVRISEEAGYVAIEVPKPKNQILTPNASRQILRMGSEMNIPIGMSNDGNAVAVDPRDHGAIGWIGPSRRGKTQAMKSFLYMALIYNPGASFYLFGIPAKLQKDWAIFQRAQGCLGLIGDPDEMTAIVEHLRDMVQNRPRQHPLFIILDDLTALPTHLFGEALGKIAVTGAGLGYHLLIGTHGGGSNKTVGDSLVGGTMTAKIVYRPADNSSGSRSAGMRNDESGVNQLSRNPGDAIYIEHGHTMRVSTPFINDSDIAKLPSKRSVIGDTIERDRITPDHTGSHSDHTSITHDDSTRSRRSHGSRVITPTPHKTLQNGQNGEGKESVITRDLWPVPTRELTASEAQLVCQMHGNGMSYSAISEIVFGGRSGPRNAIIAKAIEAIDEVTNGK